MVRVSHFFRILKYPFMLMMIAAVMLGGTGTVFSEEEPKKNEETAAKQEAKPVNLERKEGEEPILGEGETGILVDSVSDRVLFERDADKRMFPASTTKIMTALLAVEAIERGEMTLDTEVEVTYEMLEGLDPDGSNIALKEGEIMPMRDLLRGLMIPSGNDAANVIAVHVGKSTAAFVDMMNARAAELGAADTHFANPNGLHDDNHYTTAADMAKISCAAMKYETFRDIVDIAHIKIPPTNITEKERYYINTNGLISNMRYTKFYYKGSIGIKTGYTGKAGNCLVSAAVRNGVELIGVVFGGKDVSDSHKDSIEMLDWGFESFVTASALKKDDMPCEIKVRQGKGTDSLTLSVLADVQVVVPRETKIEELEIKPNIPEAVYAPIKAGDKIGTVTVLLNGEELGRGELIANKSVERSFFWPVMALGEWLWDNSVTRTIIYILIACAVIFVVIFIAGIYRNIKKARLYRRRRRGGKR